MHSEDGKIITSKEFGENLIKLRTAIVQAESLLASDSPSVENINNAQRYLSDALALNLPWSVKDREIRASRSETVRQLYKTARESSGMGSASSVGIQGEISQRQGVALAQVINSDVRQQAILRDFQTMDTNTVYDKYWGKEIKAEIAEIEYTNQLIQQISALPDDTPEQRAEKDRRWKSLAEQEKQQSLIRREADQRRTEEFILIRPRLSAENKKLLDNQIIQDVSLKFQNMRIGIPLRTERDRYTGANDVATSKVEECGGYVGNLIGLGISGVSGVMNKVREFSASLNESDYKIFNQSTQDKLRNACVRLSEESFQDYTARIQGVINNCKTYFAFDSAQMKRFYLVAYSSYEREAKREYHGDSERINDQMNKVFPDRAGFDIFYMNINQVTIENAGGIQPMSRFGISEVGTRVAIEDNLSYSDALITPRDTSLINNNSNSVLGKWDQFGNSLTVSENRTENIINTSEDVAENIDNATNNSLNQEPQSVTLNNDRTSSLLLNNTKTSFTLGTCGQPVVSLTDSRLFALNNNQTSSEK